jgi:adenine-specific DNA-methyltransferase
VSRQPRRRWRRRFSLAAQVAREPSPAGLCAGTRRQGAPKPRAAAGDPQVLAYRHADKRKNNPEVGMVTPESDPDEGKTRWATPHLDPALQFDVGRAESKLIDALASGDARRCAPRWRN